MDKYGLNRNAKFDLKLRKNVRTIVQVEPTLLEKIKWNKVISGPAWGRTVR